MELIERVRKALERDYGIKSDEELTRAIEDQRQLDIGIFVSPCGMKKVSDTARTTVSAT